MFEGAAVGIGTCSLKGHILEGNSALAKMLGYSPGELARLHIRDLLPGDQQEERKLEALQFGALDSFKQDGPCRCKNGSTFQAQITVSLVRDAQHEPAFLTAILEDFTERSRSAEKSREAEKMEVIGRLAGGIAHDFNNLLTGVLLYCDLLSAGLHSGSRLLQHVEEIRLAGEQGAALTQQLLAIARKQVPQPRPILLNDVVTSSENLLRRLIGEQIELVTALTPQLRTVLADPAQMRQVLLNLVLNARDAMPHGGRITVRTEANTPSGDTPTHVSLIVEDTGCGMDEETRSRLFEPFFTTKPSTHGTGLGMATVQRIVSASGGTIHVTSEPGRGSSIEVLLPALDSVPSSSPPQKRPTTRTTVLLVDDHASARGSIQRVLQHAGYNVLPASSGKRALRIFAERSAGVDLLIADWMMPGMSGRELAEKLRREKPDLKVLLISGYHDSRDEPVTPSINLIRKPFAGGVLLERIREVMNSKGDSSW
jgi:PAS domain S-box-containing protein